MTPEKIVIILSCYLHEPSNAQGCVWHLLPEGSPGSVCSNDYELTTWRSALQGIPRMLKSTLVSWWNIFCGGIQHGKARATCRVFHCAYMQWEWELSGPQEPSAWFPITQKKAHRLFPGPANVVNVAANGTIHRKPWNPSRVNQGLCRNVLIEGKGKVYLAGDWYGASKPRTVLFDYIMQKARFRGQWKTFVKLKVQPTISTLTINSDMINQVPWGNLALSSELFIIILFHVVPGCFLKLSPWYLLSHMLFYNMTLQCPHQEVKYNSPPLEYMLPLDLLAASRMWLVTLNALGQIEKGHGASAWLFWDIYSGEVTHHGSSLPIL